MCASLKAWDRQRSRVKPMKGKGNLNEVSSQCRAVDAPCELGLPFMMKAGSCGTLRAPSRVSLLHQPWKELEPKDSPRPFQLHAAVSAQLTGDITNTHVPQRTCLAS